MTHLRVAIVALAYLVGTLGHGGKLVLCIADKGHVAVKPAAHGCWEDADDDEPLVPRVLPRHTGDAPDGACCRSCTDIPLPSTTSPPHVAAGKKRLSDGDAVPAATVVEASSVAGPRAAVRAVAVPPSLPPLLASLRTVVLLA